MDEIMRMIKGGRSRGTMRRTSLAKRSFVEAREAGVSAVEFAIVLPMTLALVLIVLGMAVGAYDRLSAAYGVAEDTRAASIAGSLGSKTSTLVGRSPSLAASASGCTRLLQGVLDTSGTRDWPVIEWLGNVLFGPMTVDLSGSSTAVRWEFSPGFDGECQ